MKLTKRQIEAKLEEIAGDMITAEFSKNYEKYWELREDQVLLVHKLETGDYLPDPPLPCCENCLRPTAQIRIEHVEHGDAAQCWALCPRCQPPTPERWVEIQRIKHGWECGCGQDARHCPHRVRAESKVLGSNQQRGSQET
jgi:hypothetical protein